MAKYAKPAATTDTAEERLERLHSLRMEVESIRDRYTEEINALIPAKVRAAIRGLEQERDSELATIEKRIEIVTEKVKAAVLELGETVQVDGLMAKYAKPRVMWDHGMLDGIAAMDPRVAAAKRTAETGSVSICPI